jgi:hypothetical protein
MRSRSLWALPRSSKLDSSLPARLVDLVAERCERCVAILDRSAPKVSDAGRDATQADDGVEVVSTATIQSIVKVDLSCL